MSFRKYTAAAAAFFAATTLAGVGLTQAGAAGNGGLPFITGGGHTQNNNSGAANPLTTFGGFNARATSYDEENDVYPAKGEVQGRTSDNASKATVGKVHGDVVCIKNLGPASGVDAGGGPEDNDVWEIRFVVERSTVLPAGAYGSLIVQDNGPHNDFADETFEAPADPNCGDSTQFQLEPHQGQITVHNGG